MIVNGQVLTAARSERNTVTPMLPFKQAMERPCMLQELLINKIKTEVERRFLNRKYRGFELCQIIEDKMYWKVMEDPEIERLFRSGSLRVDEARIDRVINEKIDQIRMGPLEYPIRVIKDVLLWLLSRVRRGNKTPVDVVIPVNQKKYFTYTEMIMERLEQEGKVARYYVFSKARREINGAVGRSRLMKEGRTFPIFWNPAYYLAANVCRSIDKVLGTWLDYRPQKALIVEGDTSILHTIGFVSRVTGCETSCLQWGSIGTSVPKTGWRNMPFDRFLAWGEFFRESVELYNPGIEVRTVGHPNLDVRTGTKTSGIRHKTDDSPRIVLFAVQKIMKPFINGEDLDRFIHTAVDTARQMPEHTIRIRSHPNYPIPAEIKKRYAHIRNIEWHDYFSASLDESLKNTLVCVTISSTLSFEAMNYGAVPVFLKVNNIRLYLHGIGHLFNKITGNGIRHVAEPDEIVDVIKTIAAMNLNNFDTDFLFKETGRAAVNNIVAELN